MPYNRINWKNGEAGNTPLNQTNLNHMEDGIKVNEGDIAENKSAIGSAELAIDALQLRPTFAIVNTSKSPLKESGSSNILAIDVLANSKQYITKNVLPLTNLRVVESKGITFTPYYNSRGLLEYVDAHGTSTARAQYGTSTFTLAKGTYIFSQGTSNVSCFLAITEPSGNTRFVDLNGKEMQGFELTSDASCIFTFDVRTANITLNHVKIYPMIRLASITDNTYVPYTGQPAPDNIIPIIDASGVIETRTKNKINLEQLVLGRSWNEQSIAARGYVQFDIENGETYTAQVDNFDGIEANIFFMKNETEIASKNNQKLTYDSTSKKYKYTFTADAPDIAFVRMLFVAASGTLTSSMVEAIKPMVAAGNVVTEYEAHKESSVNIDGNLIDDVIVGRAWNNTAASNRAIAYAKVEPGNTYTLEINGSTSHLDSSSLFFVQKVNKTDNTAISSGNLNGIIRVKAEANANYIGIQCNKDNITAADVEKCLLQIERGTKRSKYQSFADSQHIVLRSAEDIRDELVIYEGGAGKHIKKVKIIDMGDYSYGYNAEQNYFYTSAQMTDKKVGSYAMLCNKYKIVNSTANMPDKSLTSGYSNNYIFIKNTDYGSDVNALKNSLTGTVLYYELETPIVTELTREQVRQILALRTYSPETYIDSDLDVTITYAGDPKAYIDERTKGGEVYSTEEVEIGTWEGEKLYRRIMNFTAPRTSGTDNIYHFDPAENCNVKNFYGTIIDTNFALNPINFYKGSGRYSYLTFDASGTGNFYMEVGGAMTGAQCTLVVEYTKTEYNLAALNEGDGSQPAPLALIEGEE